ncbi:hypothetical protein IAQ61_005394, partial [Plenodomus lingam]|uniref:uncharacterized protein n=1 Tax=Leptosphaeria maculans TaxID=5022 RepID=UPI0033288DE1
TQHPNPTHQPTSHKPLATSSGDHFPAKTPKKSETSKMRSAPRKAARPWGRKRTLCNAVTDRARTCKRTKDGTMYPCKGPSPAHRIKSRLAQPRFNSSPSRAAKTRAFQGSFAAGAGAGSPGRSTVTGNVM